MVEPEYREELGQNRPFTRTAFAAGLAVVAVVGVWVRCAGLTSRELWFDESCTFYAVHHLADWPTDGPDPQRELAHIPYFAALHLWCRFAGETVFGMRSFSALMGCAGVLALAFVGASIGGRRVGIIAAVLAAVNPLQIHYSQEARVYTMWVLEAALALYVLHKAARTLRPRWWFAFGAMAWLMAATHYYTLLWLPASFAAVLITPQRMRFVRSWLITHIGVAIAFVPVAWFFLIPLAAGGPRSWLREIWLGYPPALAIPGSIWALLPAGGYPSYLGSLAAAGQTVDGWIGAILGRAVVFGPAVLVVALGSAVAFTRHRVGDGVSPSEPATCSGATPDSGRAALFLFASVGVFLVVAFCHSWLLGPSYVVGRYDLITWPAVTIGIAILIDGGARRVGSWRGKRGWVRGVALVGFVGCSVATLIGARSVPVTNELADRAKRIAALVSPDDLVVSVAMYRWFMTYEWHRIGFGTQVISFPPAHGRQLCWDNPEAELNDEKKLAADIAETLDQIERAFDRGRRVWLLAHGEPTGARWQVDQHLFAVLGEAGIAVHLADENAGLAELMRSPPSTSGGESSR